MFRRATPGWARSAHSLAALACGVAGLFLANGAGADGPLRVAASVQPVAFLVSRIGGEAIELTSLVPPGASPHAFEPIPGDVRRLSQARLFVRVGAGFDDWTLRLLGAAPPDVVSLTLAELAAEGGEHRNDGRHDPRHAVDPHFWLDPLLVRDVLAPGIAAQLARLDPARAAGYRERLARFQDELTQLDREIARLLAPVRGRPYVAFHNAWRRFADRYGLEELGVVQEFGGEEPTPRELARLVVAARDAGVAALLVEPQLDPRVARAVAAEFAAGTVLVDPLGDPRDPARAGYVPLLRFNAKVFASVLERGGS